MTFDLAWPDGSVQRCWSPSLVMWDHLAVGAAYPVAELAERTTRALAEAGERVRARYGFLCTSALEQAEAIRERAAGQSGDVRVVAMAPPLPAAAGAGGEPR